MHARCPVGIADAQRLAREWAAAHPREPHCIPLPASGRIGLYRAVVVIGASR